MIPPDNSPLPAQELKSLRCFFCTAENEVPADAISLVCVRCGKANDLESYEIETVHNRAIQTHGEVIIGVRGKYHGPKLAARRLVVMGVLDSAYDCHELVLCKMGHLSLPGTQRNLHVMAGTRVRLSRPVEVVDATISGFLEVPELIASGQVTVTKGGVLMTTLTARSVRVEKGAQFDGTLNVGVNPPKPTNAGEIEYKLES